MHSLTRRTLSRSIPGSNMQIVPHVLTCYEHSKFSLIKPAGLWGFFPTGSYCHFLINPVNNPCFGISALDIVHLSQRNPSEAQMNSQLDR